MAFQMRSESKPKKGAPSEEVLAAADTVFEHHDEKADYSAIETLSDDLLDTAEPHEANQVLEPTETVETRTVRHPREKPVKKQLENSDESLDLDL